jgi:Domain of unknown function (DUF4352)
MMTRFSLRIPYFLTLTPLAASLVLAGCSESSKSAGRRLYNMGERVEAGVLVYTVLEAEWQPQLGEGADARVPRHQYLMLRLSITNSGIREVAIPRLKVVGPGGESHEELTDGDRVPNWLGMLRSLKPTETMEGRVLFDVPRLDYKLEVSEDAFDPEHRIVALVEVPLRFATGGTTLPESTR